MSATSDRLQPLASKVAELLEGAEEDLLAFVAFPASHSSKLRPANPLERVDRKIGRRADVVAIFPNDAAALRLSGAMLIEQNGEWLVRRRYLSEESMRLILDASTELSISFPNDDGQEDLAALCRLSSTRRAATPLRTT